MKILGNRKGKRCNEALVNERVQGCLYCQRILNNPEFETQWVGALLKVGNSRVPRGGGGGGRVSFRGGAGGGAFAPSWNAFAPPWKSCGHTSLTMMPPLSIQNSIFAPPSAIF